MTTKFGLKKLETSLYGKMQKVFRHLESFRRGSQVLQTDGRTEPSLPIARLTARAKNCKVNQKQNNVKKLNSLQRLLRTTAANSQT